MTRATRAVNVLRLPALRRRPLAAAPAAGTVRRWRWAVVGGLAGGAVALVLNAPASWLASRVAQATAGHVLLADAQGTVWRGSALPVLTGGPDSRDASVLPGRLSWRLSPAWAGGPALSVQAEQPCCMAGRLELRLRPGIGRTTLELMPAPGGIGQWPSAWLAGLGTPWNTLQLGGSLRLQSPGLTLESVQGRWRIAGAAEVELLGLSSRLSTLPVLGSYRLRVDGDPGSAGALLTLSTTDGALRLDGSGRWDAGGLRLRGEARAAAPEHEAVLGNLLNIIGRRQGARSVISIG